MASNTRKDGAPTGLPGVKPASRPIDDESLDNAVDRSRMCPKCGKPGRIVSNHLGVIGHCGPCKFHWPITNGPLRPELPVSIPRGISKQTHVEPDWNFAFEDLDYK